MTHPHTPPPAEHRAARLFNLGVAAWVFCLMLAFAVWVAVTALAKGQTDVRRAVAGAVLAGAALMLLAAVRAAWRSGEPLQHDRRLGAGLALFGIGATLLLAGTG